MRSSTKFLIFLLAVAGVAGYLIRCLTLRLRKGKKTAEGEQTQQQDLQEYVRQLEESERRLSSVLNNALDAVISMNDQGIIAQWNPHAEIIFGIPRQDAVGRRLSEAIIPHRYQEAHENGLKNYMRTGEGRLLNRRIEISALRRDGTEFPIELTITPVRTRAGVSFYAFLRDITERKSTEAERTRLMNELKEAVQTRDDFISVASHELKTPVTALKLQFQMAGRQIEKQDQRAYAPEQVNKLVLSVNRQIRRMTKLIDDMLDVSRVNAGRLELELEETDLGRLVRDAAESFREQLTEKGSSLDVQAADGLIVNCDRYRIEQVLSNLLTNATKYGGGSPVSVCLERAGNNARLTVADRGKGIQPEDLKRIFGRFEQLSSSSGLGGLGLGLYITRQIVEAHGGKVWAESTPGEGARFLVELPLVS